MGLNATDFFLKYRGKHFDFDGTFGAQCVDVIKAYFNEVLGIDHVSGNAIDYWRDIPGFIRIKNSSFAWPKPGDIIVWNTNVSPFGHIGIVNWVRSFDFGVFEQNYPIGHPCHYRQCNYSNVLGWLRPLQKQTQAAFNVLYLSDTDDIGASMGACRQKITQFSKGNLTLNYSFRSIPKVTAPNGSSLPQQECWNVINEHFSGTYHGAILGYHGNVYGAWYHTATTNKPILYSAGQKPWPPDVLLFELAHQLVKFYNRFRGSNPYIENIDNYSGGEPIVKAKIESLLPYLSVFNEHNTYQ